MVPTHVTDRQLETTEAVPIRQGNAEPEGPHVKPPDIVVATLLHRYGETGIQTHINEFGRHVVERGGKYEIVTPFSYCSILVYPVFAFRKIIQPLSGPLSVWWYRTFHYFFLKLALARKLKNEERPVIYACCPVSAKAALLARRSPDQKVVTSVLFNKSHAYEWALKKQIRPGDWVYNGIEKLEAEVLPKVDALVFLTRFMQQELEERIPAIAKVKSASIPLFTSSSQIADGEKAAGDIISIGTLEPRKNQSYLLRVLAEARSKGFIYSLTLVGDGPDRSRLVDLANELGLQDQVRFLGFQPNAASYVARHRVYAHSAVMEGFGLVLIESMAQGKPLLAAPVGGIPEVFADGVEGAYWHMDEPEEGAEKLIGLLEDPEAYQRAARAAKERFEQHFSPPMVVSRLIDYLSEVRNSGAPPGR